MRKFFAIGALAMLASLGFSQSNLTGRTFTYDGSTATNGTATFEYDQNGSPTVFSSGTLNNSVSGASATGASFGVVTKVKVKAYVYISGNFSGVFTVTGIGAGSGSSVSTDNLVEVRSNKALSFATSGFDVLTYDDGSAVPAAKNPGTVAYTLEVFSGFTNFTTAPSGSALGSATGTDAGFNSKTVAFTLADLPSNGKMTLRLQRTLTLTAQAEGGKDYKTSGTIAVTVN